MSEQITLPLDIDERTEADRANRKTVREELSEQLVRSLEADKERALRARREHPPLLHPDAPTAVHAVCARHEGEASAYGDALYLARALARSTEEQLRREEEHSRRTPHEIDVQHARHIDDCPVCRDQGVARWDAEQERQRLEAARSAVVMFAHQLGDHPDKATRLAKALIKHLSAALYRHE